MINCTVWRRVIIWWSPSNPALTLPSASCSVHHPECLWLPTATATNTKLRRALTARRRCSIGIGEREQSFNDRKSEICKFSDIFNGWKRVCRQSVHRKNCRSAILRRLGSFVWKPSCPRRVDTKRSQHLMAVGLSRTSGRNFSPRTDPIKKIST